MEDFNLNVLWCRALIEELLHSGLRQVVICPGGRSAALAMVLRNHFHLDVIVHGDERSGAFMALGMARISQRPVAICTTSGSAVANVIPALTEAYAAGIPLILLSCDRPRSQREAGAPQTTNQTAICQPVVQACLDLDDPEATESSLLRLRQQINAIVCMLYKNPQQGPIQINIPLYAVTCTTEIDANWKVPDCSALALWGKRDPLHHLSLPFQMLDAAESYAQPDMEALITALNLRPGLRGLIMASVDCPLSAEQVTQLSLITQFPVFADAPSQLRRPAIPHLIHQADALVMGHMGNMRADIIIRLGGAPIAHTLQSFLAKQHCPILRIDNKKINCDFLHTTFTALQNPTSATLLAIAQALKEGDKEWLTLWLQSNQRSTQATEEFLQTACWSDVTVAALACNNVGFDWIHLANSLSIRLGNLLCHPSSHSQAIFANRGVNGIDGTLGTFLGELYGSQQRGLLLIGDQTFLHDLPALTNANQQGVNGCICVVNNQGNALFDLLAMSRLPNYTALIRNPSAVDFSALAAAFHLTYECCTDAKQLRSALATAAKHTGIYMIEAVLHNEVTATSFMDLYTTIAKSATTDYA
jgi:2-succinyl-5-enolpyruvyl-6-hydroxy-3-cyclohexene-1-carboxylate synthase